LLLHCILPGSICSEALVVKSPVGLNYYFLMLPNVLLTSTVDVTIEFLTDITYDTVKRFKRHLAIPLTGILICDNIHDTTLSDKSVLYLSYNRFWGRYDHRSH
jgi:hypothetical protein